ncbi:adiponectin receptor protein [Thraustotheca clavata]|uniref:Adiponectin receptor protein n=1 Tax=Thraustotheca clavata TaxID=74557 RepID=A0A1V9Y7X3_9STRA|nr:adiponectin receptor protein [Thraustotheca clavata]
MVNPAPSARASNEKRKRLDAYHALEDEGFSYLGDNSYIHHGYRLHYSLKESFLSLFELHNETMNVWTHLIGSIIFWSLLISVCLQVEADRTIEPHHAIMSTMPFLQGGQHTLRLFTAHTATSNSERLVMQSLSLDGSPRECIEAASALMFNEATFTPITSHLDENDATELAQLQYDMQLLEGELVELMEHAWVNRHMTKQLLSLQNAISNRIHLLQEHLSPTVHLTVLKGLNSLDEALSHLANELNHQVPTWPMAVFIASAILCLSCSATFHLLYVVNMQIYFFLSRMDYAGIAVLIAGSFYPLIYYSFYCFPYIRTFYLATISILAGLTFGMSLIPKFSTLEYLYIRTCIFIGLGLFGIIPVTHLCLVFGVYDEHVTVVLGPLLLMAFLYIFGAFIYSIRFPERFYPGGFDVWGGSHQVWHCFVVAAALVHYFNVTQQYEWRWNNSCPAV